MKQIIGITGGIGTGKSQVCKILQEHGVYVIDADQVARKVVQKGEKALPELVSYFGEEILLPGGELDRKKLADIVFDNSEKLGMLNQITHKYIIEETNQMIKNSSANIVAIEAALLIESGMHKMCDKVISVISDRETRIARILARDHLSRKQAIKRIESQQSDEFYIRHADFVIINNKGIKELEDQVLNCKENICVSSY